MIIVLSVLTLTVVVFVFELLRIDIAAIIAMLLLVWTRVLSPSEALSGFSSSAVIAMMAVMIMGRGISDTGVMNALSDRILKITGKSRKNITGAVSGVAGLMSAFVQNVGAVALFLPAVLNISKKQRISPSKLIMPLGFSAITGGTLTMIASGPLIILNDILRSSGLEPYSIFSVTPVGLILLFIVIMYFYFFGNIVLPGSKNGSETETAQQKLINSWQLPDRIFRYSIPENSPLKGLTPESSGIWQKYSVHILAVSKSGGIGLAPWRNTVFKKGQDIVVLGKEENVKKFSGDMELVQKEKLDNFKDLSDPDSAGFAEILIPPRSALAGRSVRDVSFRKEYSVEPVLIFSGNEKIEGDYSDRKFRAGDTVVVHGMWEKILKMKDSDDLIVITPFKAVKNEPKKAVTAVSCFAGALILTLVGFPISISLFTGAFVMVLLKVITIEDLYKAIDWKVVFLIAGLIPLGIAVQKSGTAVFIAEHISNLTGEGNLFLTIILVAVLSSVFSIFMSNVASTVVLAPVVISMAGIANTDPRPLVLLTAVCSANSFVLPTHQVNAMLMTPGGYSNRDYFKAGGGISILFLITVTVVFYLFYF
ncbi:MAG: SLC13 family permease [Candidatus Delongbacteria bacterium]